MLDHLQWTAVQFAEILPTLALLGAAGYIGWVLVIRPFTRPPEDRNGKDR